MSTRGDSTRGLSRTLARFNRNVANPVVRLLAGRLPPLAIVLHRGRTTGRDFATPVLAFRTPDGLVVGVLYGTVSDWVRNLQASGGGQVKRRGTTCSYGQPRLVSRNDGLQLVPGFLRGPFRALGVQNFIRLSLITPDDPADRK
jgi:deazaflavin-dependent oxidoreductase (nitroreductase family)